MPLLTVLVLTARAEDPPAEGERVVVYRPSTEIDFEGVEITGELVKP